MGFKLITCWLVEMLLVSLHPSEFEAATTGLLPEGRQCACAGDRLIYNCTVVGGGSTVWSGTALDCPLANSEITLRHSQFVSNQAFGICNNGNIVGRGIEILNNCYTSQLNVTVGEGFNNKTVLCIQNSIQGTREVGQSILSVASATSLYPPPDNINVADIRPGKLVFTWTPVISNCSTLQYDVTSTSDCGTCEVDTNTTTITATCSDLPLTTDAVTCHFRVSTRACHLVGNPSSPIVLTLKLPSVPQVKLVPSYSNDSQALERLFIIKTMNQTEDIFNITGGISGSPTSYIIHASNLGSDTSFNAVAGLTSCKEDNGCPVELTTLLCPQSDVINVTLSAANNLGEGLPSNAFVIECTNTFVQARYVETTSESTISCIFLNPSDSSEKTCCVTHGECDKKESENVQECKSDPPYKIELQIPDRSEQRYCYTVTASNDTYTVKVGGTFTLGDNHRRRTSINRAAILAGVLVPLLLLVGTGIIVGVYINLKRSKHWQPQRNEDTTTRPIIGIISSDVPSLKQYLVPYHLPSTLKLQKVPIDCHLRQYITEVLNVKHGFRRGHTYYEFTNEVENIPEGKQVLLQDRMQTTEWFKLDQAKVLADGRFKLYGEGIARNSFREKYRVFIQSFGSGARYLPRDSYILYDRGDDQVEPDVLPLVPVCSEYFAHKDINSEEECTAEDFCTRNKLSPKALNVFLTVEHLPERMRDQPPRDVILMDRESRRLFTGPKARQTFDPKSGRESEFESERWKVFVLLERNKKGLILQKGSEVLYQDLMHRTGNYRVLEVGEDDVRMSKFIETKLNCQYEDGKAFYEVTENDSEENLLYCKKILRPQTNELNQEKLQLESLIEYFYAIPGVPSKAVKPEQLRLDHHKIFIQCTSQGSRCLKKGEKILYLKEYVCSNPPTDAQAGDLPGDSD